MLYFALKHPATPLLPKLVTLLTLIYLISPLDIIPDPIPFFGLLDDLIIVPLLIGTAVKLLPMQVRVDSEQNARLHTRRLSVIFTLILVVLIVIIILLFLLTWHLLHAAFSW